LGRVLDLVSRCRPEHKRIDPCSEQESVSLENGKRVDRDVNQIIDCLKSIEKRLASIEQCIARPKLGEVLVKGRYSVEEVAELTNTYGVKHYRPFTVRLACKDQRVPEASKLEGGKWVIPREAVLRILQEGLPPERRG